MLDRDIEDYLAHCRAKRLSRKTVQEIYGPNLKLFLAFAQSQGVERTDQIDQRLMDRYSIHLQDYRQRSGKALAARSVHSYTRTVNGFLNWAREEGEDIKAKGQLPRLPKPLLDILTRDEIQRLEDAAQSERDRLIIRLLADTGIRVGELCGLTTADVKDTGRNYTIHVTGKGERARLVPLMRPLYQRLRRHIDRGRPAQAATEHVFLSLRMRPSGMFEPITPSGVEQMLKQVADRAGITRRVWPHQFRHSFVTFALQKGMNPVQLARIVGHTSLDLINTIYSHLSPDDAADAMAKLYA